MRHLSLFVFLLASLFLVFGCGIVSEPVAEDIGLAPHKTEVYFLMNNKSSGLVAYVPEGSVSVGGVKVDLSATKPYVLVPRRVNKNKWAGPVGEYIAWGYGGTLYVKDVQQVKDLLIQ